MPTHSQPDADTDLFVRVRDLIQREALWCHGAQLLLAVSGGPDSVVLLHLLHSKIAPCEALRLSVVHVHHCLRPEADDDASFVEEMAHSLGIPFFQRRVDVPAHVAECGETVEEAARTLRYAALDDVAREVGADAIVTGHTADDQAETVLMRILRGTGATGLCGMPAKRGRIVRPLLSLWRADIDAYVQRHQLPFRIDGSNASMAFTRNRLRRELLPMLETEYAPRLRERLVKLAALSRQDNEALELLTDSHYAQSVNWLPDGIAIVPEANVPMAITSRLWRRAIADVRGDMGDISYEHIADIAALLPGDEVHLPGVRVLNEAGRLVFLSTSIIEKQCRPIIERPLPAEGCLVISEINCRLTMEQSMERRSLVGGDHAVLDAEAVHGAIMVRGWLPGDRFRPFGAPGSRKLQDIFVDAGVPRRWRERIPVLADADGIIWLAGFRLADRVKILPTTTRRLYLSIEWEFNPWI